MYLADSLCICAGDGVQGPGWVADNLQEDDCPLHGQGLPLCLGRQTGRYFLMNTGSYLLMPAGRYLMLLTGSNILHEVSNGQAPPVANCQVHHVANWQVYLV